MSDPTPATSSRARQARILLVVFAVGLLVGALCVVMLLRALEARKTWEDRWHDATMQVMDAQLQSLGVNIRQNRCGATDTLPRLQSLRFVANDIEPAFPGLRDDQRFVQHASALRSELDAALSSPPLNCEGVGAAVARIGQACKACHQDYR